MLISGFLHRRASHSPGAFQLDMIADGLEDEHRGQRHQPRSLVLVPLFG